MEGWGQNGRKEDGKKLRGKIMKIYISKMGRGPRFEAAEKKGRDKEQKLKN